MDAQLLIWIVERYTEVGETILDPMAGSGTLMLACGLGRNVVLVELEEKFCKIMRDNWEEVRMRPQLGYGMGECQIIQGDARNLEGLVDKIITSPPYALTVQKGHEGVQAWKVIEGLKNADNETLRAKSRELASKGKIVNQYGDNPGNIGNLPYGQVDKIVTSPPYAQQGEPAYSDSLRNIRSKMGRNPDLPYCSGEKVSGPNNISNLSYGSIDSIITSPPYEGTNTTGRPDTYRGAHGPHSQVQIPDYRESDANIGNLKGDTYLSAMLQVYQQCHAVLKPQGLMILVAKNFIRNKQVVRLDTDTIKLCEQAGFTYLERHYRKLPAQSFWRTIYKSKYPDAPTIDFEDVLVFSKASVV